MNNENLIDNEIFVNELNKFIEESTKNAIEIFLKENTTNNIDGIDYSKIDNEINNKIKDNFYSTSKVIQDLKDEIKHGTYTPFVNVQDMFYFAFSQTHYLYYMIDVVNEELIDILGKDPYYAKKIFNAILNQKGYVHQS